MDKQVPDFRTQITSINGKAVDPIPVTVVTRFSPRQELAIEVDSMPRELTLSKPPSKIEVDGSAVPLHVLHSGGPFVDVGGSGKLVPVRAPCQVVRDDACFCEVQFDILNFFNLQRMFGTGSKWHSDVAKNRGYLIGKACIKADPWLIKIEEVDNVDEIVKQGSGIRVAHTGTINRLDGRPFRADSLLRLLKGLRQFLSFAGGSGIGLSQVRGTNETAHKHDVRWGTEGLTEVANKRFAWLPNNTGTDALSEGFVEYYRQTNSSTHVCFAIEYATSVYIESVDSTSLSVLPHIQIALEALCSLKAKNVKPMVDALKRSLQIAGIPIGIPQWASDLETFCKANGFSHGPAALVKLRNWMVHGDPRVANATDSVLWEANELGLWYVELLLLHQFNYRGRYRIRGTGAVESVPWGIHASP